MNTTDDIIYNDIGRFYNIDGSYYPSVTTILSHSKKDFYENWSKKIGKAEADKILKYTSERGNEVHSICEEYLKSGNIIKSTPMNYFLFLKIKKWLDENVKKVISQESLLFSHKMKIAGRVDLIAETYSGLQIIDFKTSTNVKNEEWIENYFLQCAAYAICNYEMTGKFIEKFSVVITEEKSNKVNVFTKQTIKFVQPFILLRKEFKKCYDI